MSKIYGELPTHSVVMAACDSKYFTDHAPAFVYSADKVNKDVHIHVVNPTDEVFSLAGILNATTDVKVTYSFNDVDFPPDPEQQRTYFACLRFLVAPTILQTAEQLLILDIDGMCMNDFSYPEAPVGFYPREPLPGTVGWENEGTSVAAGAVYYNKFGKDYALKVAQELQTLPMRWFVDQIALSRVLGDVKEAHHFDSEFMDWEFKEGTTIWTGKGPRKYDNPTYVAKKKEFTDMLAQTQFNQRVILKPRLDMPFKKFGLEVGGSPLIEIREHWQRFVDNTKDADLVVEMPRWMFNNTICNFFPSTTTILVPHVEKERWKGTDNCLYYMQTVFPWLFTVDPLGWAGGSAYQHTYDPHRILDKQPFIDLQEYMNRGGTKFAQPDTKWEEKDPYILVPLQLPHDETIKWHSDIDVPTFVTELCKWADSENGMKIVFKGHPVNLGSMEPLKEIISDYKNVRYVDNCSIHDMMEQAEAVYVINSGTGQEAMLLEKTVVTFGRCDYDSVTIKGLINDLDFTWEAVKLDDKAKRVESYMKWYDWFVNDICIGA